MKVSVITPSFRQPEWLRLCMASVADQRGTEIEHIVQDNCSGEAVRQIVSGFPKARLFEEADSGMYDAVNRGLKRATGELCAYLNCDEQYLPWALSSVADYFTTHPDCDVLFADTVVTNSAGGYLCSRQVVKPMEGHTRLCHLNTLTAATFFRRRLVERGFLFDPRWKAVGDAVWVLDLLKAGVKMDVMRAYTSVFAETGSNTGRTEVTVEEEKQLQNGAPDWQRRLTPWYALHHRFRRWQAGCYRLVPFTYDVYTMADPGERRHIGVVTPTFLWPDRFEVAG